MADVCPKCGIQAVEDGVCQYCGDSVDDDTSEGAAEGADVAGDPHKEEAREAQHTPRTQRAKGGKKK